MKFTARLNPELFHAAARERETLNRLEAADFLGVSPNTITRWINEGKIPCRKMGRRVLFNRDALRRWSAGVPVDPLGKPDASENVD